MKVGSDTCLRAGVIALALFVGTSASAYAQAVITNGTGIALGVNREGHLNVYDPSGITSSNAGYVGVSFDFGGGDFRDATAPGCLCEGWGVAVNGTTSGFANISTDGGANNLTVDSFSSTASTATSEVHLTSLAGLSVTHEYKPSTSAALYEAVVTITNNTGGSVDDVLYRRVMDWDVPPTEFNEYVTIQGSLLGNNVETCNNGFNTANPLVACSQAGLGAPLILNTDFVDSGRFDHGALFTFNFGALADGASRTFSIFYGAAAGEAAALAALAAVGAEGIYSLGQSDPLGRPATFIFGFGGVGAPPIVPEPATLFLIGGGLATAMVRRYRRG